MNWKRSSFKIGAIIWLVGLGVAFAVPGEDFKSANQLYDAGKFAEAGFCFPLTHAQKGILETEGDSTDKSAKDHPRGRHA